MRARSRLSDRQRLLVTKLGLPETVFVDRAALTRTVERSGAFASDTLLIGSLVAVYAFLQYSIVPEWPAWVLAPLCVLSYRLAISRLSEASVTQRWLRLTAAMFVPFAAVYTPLQWAISPDWVAWVLAPLIVLAAWSLLAIGIEAFDDL